jgi:hypothetical protein
MGRNLRAILLTLALVIAGFVLGVLAIGSGGALGLLLRPDGSGIAGALLGLEAAVGGTLGAVLLPASTWLLLRRVPLWQVLLAPAVGAALGHALEWTLLSQTTFGGAAIGMAVAVLALVFARGRGMRGSARFREGEVSARPRTT